MMIIMNRSFSILSLVDLPHYQLTEDVEDGDEVGTQASQSTSHLPVSDKKPKKRQKQQNSSNLDKSRKRTSATDNSTATKKVQDQKPNKKQKVSQRRDSLLFADPQNWEASDNDDNNSNRQTAVTGRKRANQSSGALRKSRRQKITPLEFWRNEKPVYGRRESSSMCLHQRFLLYRSPHICIPPTIAQMMEFIQSSRRLLTFNGLNQAIDRHLLVMCKRGRSK
jgi:hypothetical protein